jgi:hypothetical protein
VKTGRASRAIWGRARACNGVRAGRDRTGFWPDSWGEWYPDVLGPDGKLTTAKPKPYWQPGWLKQHDRLMESIAAVRERVPLVMSGDLHAVAVGRMMRSGKLDFSANPINAVLTGPISTRPSGWPSARLGTRRDRAARLHHRGFCARQDCAANVQVGCEDAKRRGDRQPRSVPHGRTDPGGVRRALMV